MQRLGRGLAVLSASSRGDILDLPVGPGRQSSEDFAEVSERIEAAKARSLEWNRFCRLTLCGTAAGTTRNSPMVPGHIPWLMTYAAP
jgi:hypothetical protein